MKYLVFPYGNGILSALLAEGQVTEFQFHPASDGPACGDIYVAVVKNIKKGIDAAFVELADGINCYYPLKENPQTIFLTPGDHDRLREGDLILVQVEREAVKTKQPLVTSKITLQGQYVALVRGIPKLAFSSKLTGDSVREWKEAVRNAFADVDLGGYGAIVRTNAALADPDAVKADAMLLAKEVKELTERAVCMVGCSCVKKSAPLWLRDLCDVPRAELSEVIFEDADLLREAKEYCKTTAPELTERLRLYEDAFPLMKLYRLEKALSEALEERVWLKSGAYLVIQPTEALTVIDVNTGKIDAKKDREKTFLSVNLEAATEIARQLRLRNLSGIILIDFINLEEESHKAELMGHLRETLKTDPMRAVVVDMTPLGLVEITRRRVKKTLAEQMKQI